MHLLAIPCAALVQEKKNVELDVIFSFPKALRDHQGDFTRTSFEGMKTIKGQNDEAEVHLRRILPVVQRSVSEKDVKLYKIRNENSCLLFIELFELELFLTLKLYILYTELCELELFYKIE